uniref:Transposase n=1 Tax=Romanomermis culicivorax TaxID=13658 RepID=A0A915KCA1_ROMCU
MVVQQDVLEGMQQKFLFSVLRIMLQTHCATHLTRIMLRHFNDLEKEKILPNKYQADGTENLRQDDQYFYQILWNSRQHILLQVPMIGRDLLKIWLADEVKHFEKKSGIRSNISGARCIKMQIKRVVVVFIVCLCLMRMRYFYKGALILRLRKMSGIRIHLGNVENNLECLEKTQVTFKKLTSMIQTSGDRLVPSTGILATRIFCTVQEYLLNVNKSQATGDNAFTDAAYNTTVPKITFWQKKKADFAAIFKLFLPLNGTVTS